MWDLRLEGVEFGVIYREQNNILCGFVTTSNTFNIRFVILAIIYKEILISAALHIRQKLILQFKKSSLILDIN